MPAAQINGITIDYRVEGQGEPLVLIMGIASNKSAWLFQRSAFRKHYRVVTFDNRGVGKSGKPAGGYSIRTMADDTIGLMDHLGIEKAHILGVSMGGMIAQELAINYPERVLKLVLGCTFARMDASGGISPELQQLGDPGYPVNDARNIPVHRAVGALVSLAFNRRFNRMILMPLAKLRVGLRGTGGLPGQIEAVQRHDTLDRLHLVQAPTLVITGGGDRIIQPRSSEVITNLIPNARLVTVPNGSHTFFIEMRSRFNREVLDFLKNA